jgi:phosphonate transport system substrate-binding protein
MRKIAFFLLLISCFWVTACTNQTSPKIDLSSASNPNVVDTKNTNVVDTNPINRDNTYYFGFDRRLEIKEDVRMYVPLLRYLERETGYKFKLHITPKNASVADELGAGKVHFAAIGTVSFLQAYQKYKVVPLVRGAGENDGYYRAVIIVRPDSEIKNIREIKGRSFAFGAPNSTQGHLIPRIMLANTGITLPDLKSFGYMGSHAETANVVMSGQFEAGGIQDSLAKVLAGRGLVRIIGESVLYPRSGIVAAPGMPPEVKDAVKRALLKFDPSGKDKEGLYNWQASEMPNGFAEANIDECLILQKQASELGILGGGTL